METVYTSDNTVDAHMIVHRLEQAGINARIFGEHLQSGVGELAAHGNIRVVVDSSDLAVARECIAAWEAEQQVPAGFDDGASVSRKSSASWTTVFAFFAGFGVATAVLLWAFNSPYDVQTADLNWDGRADEWAFRRGEHVARIDSDRNFDGKADARFHYSVRDGLETAEFDDNFNGVFESKVRYKFAQPIIELVDTDEDGQTNLRFQYVDGVLRKADFFHPGSEIVRKTQLFEGGVALTEARWDADGDGLYDELIRYGPFEEETSRSPLSGAEAD